uniref:Uncharacterized protein n=1 Tax=Agrobacterium fabrum TaxID=1176649 RepID=A0A2Z2PW41_9HYPH|nr:hypothetical protein [Agrobacterium fabrum]ASK46431.1 hypothetical protein [Agrobacterium fabrum]
MSEAFGPLAVLTFGAVEKNRRKPGGSGWRRTGRAVVQTDTKPKDRSAKGLIPDAEAGEEIMQGPQTAPLDQNRTEERRERNNALAALVCAIAGRSPTAIQAISAGLG